MVDHLKTSGEWKIHLTMKMNFVSTIDSIKYHQIHSKRDNSEIMTSFGKD